MIFIMLVLSIISFSDTIHADEIVKEIKVSIVSGGEYGQSQYENQFKFLHNYTWFINNKNLKNL